MIMTNKLLPVALVAALIGGSVGAFVMHSKNTSTAGTQASLLDTSRATDAQNAQPQASQTGAEQTIPVSYNSASEQNAYKTGFAEGLRACESGATSGVGYSQPQTIYQPQRVYTQPRAAYTQPRVVYRNSGRSYARNSGSPAAVSSNTYQRPRSRSFWKKHRDKLTVAMGTGGGALIGGLIGGKKGAAIGALGGAGGSALYTYKIRNRNRRY